MYIYFCHGNSRRDWHGNVLEIFNVFGVGGIDLLTYCCEFVRNTAAPHITRMK